MIQFCEDCGQKNILNPTQIEVGKAVFKCSVCNYHNCFHIEIKNKIFPKMILELCETVGAKHFVLVDQKGTIQAHNLKTPEKTAQFVLSCAQKSFAIGKADMDYVIFPKNNQKDFFIFQSGNLFLGVIKNSDVSNTALTQNILFFLKALNITEGLK